MGVFEYKYLAILKTHLSNSGGFTQFAGMDGGFYCHKPGVYSFFLFTVHDPGLRSPLQVNGNTVRSGAKEGD